MNEEAHKENLLNEELSTPRKQAEMLQLMINQAAAGVARADLAGRYLFVNQKYCDIVGYSANELMQMRMQDITHLDDIDLHAKLLRKMVKDNSSFEIEERYIRKDGSIRWVHNNTALLKSDDAPSALAIVIDVTENKIAEDRLKESEAHLRIALEAAELAAWDWDITSNRIAWSSQHYLLLGLEPLSEKIALDFFFEFIHPQDYKMVSSRLKQALENEQGIFTADFRIIRADDKSVRWMRGFGKVVEKKENIPVRMTGVMTDVTGQKALETQKDEFIGIASHELKTPVTSIKAYAEVLQDMFTESGATESAVLMQKLNVQVDRLTDLITDLLDTTRITDGRLQLDKEECDINEVIREMAEILQHSSRKHALQLDLKPLPRIFADRQRIAQVLTNLISNAVKYAPDSEKIIISSTADGHYVTVCVKDFGNGVPEDVKKKIFERFFRVNNSTLNTFPGLGLGLYISSEIVKQHGGNIWVESEQGKGSTFCFTLPH